MTPILTVEIIADVTRDVWNALLADDGGLLPGVLDDDTGGMAATVEISGAWNGTACLSCSAAAGRHAASAMFGMDDAELSSVDIADAVGELVNVVGGNIKSLLPGPTQLSLPTFHEDGLSWVPGSLELAHEVKFSWMAEPVMVTVWNAID